MFTLTVLIGLYVQDIMGYSAARRHRVHPVRDRARRGPRASSQLVSYFPPRILVIAGGVLVLGAMLYGSTLNGGIPYFPNLVIPITVGGFGIGMIVVPLTVTAIAGVGFDQIGPVSAIALMLQNLGGPVVLAIIQAVITSRTLYLGGTTGPVKKMNPAQLHALDQGYTYGLLWVAGVAADRRRGGAVHRHTAQQVAHAQEVRTRGRSTAGRMMRESSTASNWADDAGELWARA